MNRKKILRSVAPLLALALVATACGSDDSRSNASDQTVGDIGRAIRVRARPSRPRPVPRRCGPASRVS